MVCGVHLGLLTGVLEEIGTRTRVSLVPALDGRGPCLVRLGETSVPAADPVSPHRSRSECYERAEAGPGADTGDHPERVSGPDARPGDGRLRHELLGLGAAQPARAEAEGLAAPDLVPTGADRRRTGDRGRPGPRPGWSPHRQAGRPGDVSCRVVRNHRAGAVPGLRRTLLVCRPACRRFLPRYRGNRLRGRRAVRQRVVRPRASRHGHRCLRGRHGRDGDHCADDGQALGGARHRRPVRADRRRAGGVRRGGDAAAYGVVATLLLRDAPGRQLPTQRVTTRLAAALRTPISWQASTLYAVTFGGYVAFSVYLPTYLKPGYGLAQADAANRMSGFVLGGAADRRPVGGAGPPGVRAARLSSWGGVPLVHVLANPGQIPLRARAPARDVPGGQGSHG